MLLEMGFSPTPGLRVDNTSAITIMDQGGGWRSRYYCLRAAAIQEALDAKRIKIDHVSTVDMLADILTKFMSGQQITEFINRCMARLKPSRAAPGGPTRAPSG